MKSKRTIYYLISILLVLGINGVVLSKRGGPPDKKTDAPSEKNCTDCHAGNANSGPGSLTISMTDGGNPVTQYIPDQIYTMTLTISESGINVFGFEAVILEDQGNTNAGTIIVTDQNRTKTSVSQVNGTNRTYIKQTYNGSNGSNSNTWSWDWQAPGTNVGSITIYAASLAANGDGGKSGDHCYTTTFTIQPNPCSAFSATVTTTDVSCNGGNDGSATANPSGGTAPYSYAWSDGQTTKTATNLSAGTYSVTVTDAASCTATVSNIVINEPAGMTITSSSTDVSCNGAADGSASVSVSGGSAPYTYAWSNGGTGAGISGLSGGTYSVTVTDNNGCSQVVSGIVVNEPAVLQANAVATDISCNGGSDGSITASPSGGTPPYSYAWSNGGTTATISNLSAGTYSVTVTDANNCTDVQTNITVNEPAALTATVSGTDILCNGANDGSATVTVSGGTAPYTYAWSNGATTQTASNLSAGTYTVTITDNSGCTYTPAAVTISEPPALTGSITSTNASCGNADGTATITVSGGVAPYSYAWSNGGTTNSISNLASGTYTVTVTDDNGCTITESVNVIDAGAPSVSVQSQVNIDCFGDCDGSATVSVSGGSAPYTYKWNDSQGQTSATAVNLCAGTYSVTVTDNSGCKAITTVTLTEPSPITVAASHTDVSCFNGKDGSAAVTVSGGTPPYTYLWSNGSTSANQNGLSAGNYMVTVTDNKGCESVYTVTVNEPTEIALTFITNDASCAASSDGSATVSVSGGTPPYIYLWSNGSTTQNISGLAAGDYLVTVTDNNSCQKTGMASVGAAPPMPQPEIMVVNNQLAGPPMMAAYQWYYYDTLIVGATTQFLIPDKTGFYSLVVWDDNGCSSESDPVFITITGGRIVTSADWAVYPNPFSELVTITADVPYEVSVMVYDKTGRLVNILKGVPPVYWQGTDYNGSDLPAGLYILRIVTRDASYSYKLLKD